MSALHLLFVGLCGLLSACGGAEIGERCDDVGSADECVEGAVCTNEDGDRKVCRRTCKAQEDCVADQACNGISGSSVKSCQPK